ncbi:MAG: mgtE1, partial [Verrucomicrobiales bacterium]|nr:mgtE1 [Verrucomicrobiales bacterium]
GLFLPRNKNREITSWKDGNRQKPQCFPCKPLLLWIKQKDDIYRTFVRPQSDNLQRPVTEFARKDFAALQETFTVHEALDAIRQKGVGERIVYFYVTDAQGKLTGVVPTRRLLTAPVEQRLSEFMIPRVMAIPQTATVLEACEMFVLHKFLAFPVVDEQRRMVGVVDVDLLRSEVFEMEEPVDGDDVFERIGFHITQVRDASPLRAFRFRFPWLLTTILSGTACAFLASAFEMTLARTIVLAFFLTMVLALGESVAMQSMTVTIQALHSATPSIRWYLRVLQREMITAVLLGLGCGGVVALIVWFWRGAGLPAIVIGSSIALSLCAACFFGLSVPAALHAFKLDPKISAGPVALALTDVLTLLFYFLLATWIL